MRPRKGPGHGQRPAVTLPPRSSVRAMLSMADLQAAARERRRARQAEADRVWAERHPAIVSKSQPAIDETASPEMFTCAGCGLEFEKGWEEEARAEAAANFPGEPIENMARVCDACYDHLVQAS